MLRKALKRPIPSEQDGLLDLARDYYRRWQESANWQDAVIGASLLTLAGKPEAMTHFGYSVPWWWEGPDDRPSGFTKEVFEHG